MIDYYNWKPVQLRLPRLPSSSTRIDSCCKASAVQVTKELTMWYVYDRLLQLEATAVQVAEELTLWLDYVYCKASADKRLNSIEATYPVKLLETEPPMLHRVYAYFLLLSHPVPGQVARITVYSQNLTSW